MMLDRPNNRQPWHADEIEKLLLLLANDVPIAQIARDLGRTQEAARRKAGLLGRLPA